MANKTKAEKQATLNNIGIDPVLKRELNERRDKAAGLKAVPKDEDIRTLPDLLSLQKTRKRSKRGRPPGIKGKIDGKTWSYKKRVEVLTTYLTIGVFTKTGEITGVRSETIRKWAREPWWNQLADEIRKQKEQEIDAKLTGIIDKTLNVLSDRLDNGEVIYNPRTNEQVRVPVKSIDATRIFDKVHEKRALVRGDPTQRVERITTEQRLNSLADQFTRFGKGNVQIEDADYEEIDNASEDEETAEVYGNVLDDEGQEEAWEEVSSSEGSEEIQEAWVNGEKVSETHSRTN